MATSNRRTQQEPAAEGDPRGAMSQAGGSLAVLQRQQLAALAEAWSAWYRAGESIHHAQVQRDQRAALLHRQAAENLRAATSPVELATIQGTLAMYQLQEGVRYWQELAAATVKAGNELLRAGGEGPTGLEADGAAPFAGGLGGPTQMADAFQQMFNAAMNPAPAHH
jgi:hypothetical protein